MNTDILRWLADRRDATAVYTRYADDLTISTDAQATIDAALAEIPALVARHGFAVSARKTHVYHAAAGRRIITGVAVDSQIRCTRRAKRRLRAALHHGNKPPA